MAVCAICSSNTAPEAAVALPDSVGPPDFDTRPAEPLRSTQDTWVLLCPACGYAADDLTRAAEGAADIVQSTEYAAILQNSSIPEPARKFLAYAHLLSRLHQHADAGWSALQAAWVCDDAGAPDAARHCRATCIEYWQRGKQVGQVFSEGLPSEFALITDIYRRMGAFEHATVAAGEGLELEDLPPALDAVLRRQQVLIQQQDTAAHSLGELLPS